MSLHFDVYAKVWVVLLQGTQHLLYYSASRALCIDNMHNMG